MKRIIIISIFLLILSGCGIPRAKPDVGFANINETLIESNDKYFSFSDNQNDYADFIGYDLLYKVNDDEFYKKAIIKDKDGNLLTTSKPTINLLPSYFNTGSITFYIYYDSSMPSNDDHYLIYDNEGNLFNTSYYSVNDKITFTISPITDDGFEKYDYDINDEVILTISN